MKVTPTVYVKEYELLSNSLARIPVIDRCDHLRDKKEGFFAHLIFKDATHVNLDVTVLNRAFPSIITEVVIRQKNEDLKREASYPVIMAPYISTESAKQCERLNVGYMDMSGNCRLLIRSLYASDQGHPNKFFKKRAAKTLFDPSSKVSSLILREIMRDVAYPWKLSLLSDKLRCSIGQVSKVKDYLCEQLWAQLSADGLRILDPQAIMHSWSEAYAKKAALFEVLDCHTLLPLPEFEDRIRQIKANSGIDCFLTGFAGGVRYAPVVRYTKAHLLVRERDLNAFLEAAACKQVDSGANVQIHVLASDELLHDARNIGDHQVASPVQVYLDCMRLKGRGEEMAEAILAKEIGI
ncbi:MAG: type IV toxin-antitoxin system AbiEi family antitoxin [Sphaerochaetaceae bacterium]